MQASERARMVVEYQQRQKEAAANKARVQAHWATPQPRVVQSQVAKKSGKTLDVSVYICIVTSLYVIVCT